MSRRNRVQRAATSYEVPEIVAQLLVVTDKGKIMRAAIHHDDVVRSSDETRSDFHTTSVSLELWRLPFGNQPRATAQIPVLTHAFLSGDGTLSQLFVRSSPTFGQTRTWTIYRVTGDWSSVDVVIEQFDDQAPVFGTIANGWFGMSYADELIIQLDGAGPAPLLCSTYCQLRPSMDERFLVVTVPSTGEPMEIEQIDW